MAIRVLVNDMGGLSGKHVFEFVRGAINIVKAPNATGKSTILKAIALCLSYPFKSDVLLKIARDSGLLKQPEESVEPLVHIGSNSASVTVEIDGDFWSVTLTRDGKVISSREGDERFILTSFITRESKVLRSLITGETDFSWLIENVSMARKYEIEALALEEEIVKLEEILYKIENRQKELLEIKKKIEKLAKDIDEYTKKEEMLSNRLSELLARNPEIETLRKERNTLLAKKREIENTINKKEEELRNYQQKLVEYKKMFREDLEKYNELKEKIEKTEKEINKIKKRIDELNDILKDFDNAIKRLHEEEVKLRVEEGKALALLELYNNALKLVYENKETETRCFLCQQGYLSISSLDREKTLIENRLNEIRDMIAKLIHERNNLYSYKNEKERLKEELENLQKEILKDSETLSSIKRRLLVYYDSETKALKLKIEILTKSIEELKKDLLECENKISEIDREICKLGEEEKKLVSEISELRGIVRMLKEQKEKEIKLLEDLSHVEIYGIPLPTEEAYKVCSECLEILREVHKRVTLEARRERGAAVEIFNSEVKKVLRETGFALDVWIDPKSYKLHLRDPKSGNIISPRILSEAEKYLLSLVLHLALKLSYTPHIPFMLIDEVVMSFDEKRKRTVMKYLLNLAKENGWAVVIAELGSGPGITIEVLRVL